VRRRKKVGKAYTVYTGCSQSGFMLTWRATSSRHEREHARDEGKKGGGEEGGRWYMVVIFPFRCMRSAHMKNALVYELVKTG